MRWTTFPVVMMTVMLGAGDALAATPIVDGPDSVSSAPSLIVVREQYFENVDVSTLGLLDWAAPTDQFSPNPPPWGPADAVRVQSLFIRVGRQGESVTVAGTVSFSPGVSLLGVVTDIDEITKPFGARRHRTIRTTVSWLGLRASSA